MRLVYGGRRVRPRHPETQQTVVAGRSGRGEARVSGNIFVFLHKYFCLGSACSLEVWHSPELPARRVRDTAPVPGSSLAGHLASAQIFEKINCISMKGSNSSLKKKSKAVGTNHNTELTPWILRELDCPFLRFSQQASAPHFP